MLAVAHWPSVAYGVRVTNLNPADTIGASAWLVETDGHRILLDAGTCPGGVPGIGGPRNYSNAFLPAAYQGTPLGRAGIPAKDATIKNITASSTDPNRGI